MKHPFSLCFGLLAVLFTATSCLPLDYANSSLQKMPGLEGVPGQSYQGMAVWGDYMVSLQNTGHATIYRLNNGRLEKLRQFPLASHMPENHANVASFGVERYHKSDYFPLLYVSQCSKQRHNGMKDVCFVERITLTDPPTLVQTIVLDDTHGLFGYALQWTIDSKRKLLIGYGNTVENMGRGNRWRIVTFPLPKLSDGSVVHLHPLNVIENYCIQDYDQRFPSNHIGQGACVKGDQMFIPVGVGTEQQPSILYVWNLKTKRLDNIVNYQSQVPYEFEDCEPYRRSLIMQTNGGGVVRIKPHRNKKQ